MHTTTVHDRVRSPNFSLNTRDTSMHTTSPLHQASRTPHPNLVIPRKKRLKQNTLFQYMTTEQQAKYMHRDADFHNAPWEPSHSQKQPDTTRIWMTNPNGLGTNPNNTKYNSTFKYIHFKSKADIVCLAETNLRWSFLRHAATLNNRIHPHHREFRTSTSHNKQEDLGTTHRGGTCNIALDQTSHKVTKVGQDNSGLGRWSWMQVTGRNNISTRIITAYRPCAKPTKSQLTTVWDQHSRHYRSQGIEIDPREQFLIDIETTLRDWISDGIKIVLTIDANENVQAGKFRDMIGRLGLINAHDPHNSIRLPATHKSGQFPISDIFHSPSLHFQQTGMLPFGIGIEGDHRNLYADFISSTLLGEEMFDIIPMKRRRLQLYDSRVVNKFNTILHNYLTHNIILIYYNNMSHKHQYPQPSNINSIL